MVIMNLRITDNSYSCPSSSRRRIAWTHENVECLVLIAFNRATLHERTHGRFVEKPKILSTPLEDKDHQSWRVF